MVTYVLRSANRYTKGLALFLRTIGCLSAQSAKNELLTYSLFQIKISFLV